MKFYEFLNNVFCIAAQVFGAGDDDDDVDGGVDGFGDGFCSHIVKRPDRHNTNKFKVWNCLDYNEGEKNKQRNM